MCPLFVGAQVMASLKYGIAAALLCTLAACGGGGGGGDGTPMVTAPSDPTPTTPTTPTSGDVAPTSGDGAMWTARTALLTTHTEPTAYTSLSSLPTSGTATYDGYFSGQLANTNDNVTDTLIGAMSLDVGFRTNTVQVSGSVSDFVDSDDNALTGELTLSAGRLDRAGDPGSDATLTMQARGTLTDAQGQNLVIGTQLEGDFLGTGHAAVGGEVLGSVQVNGADQDFDGGFIAQR